jgi:predicted ATP-grasp superfamily ATP-dependent carboligase
MRQRFSPGPHPEYLGSDALPEGFRRGRAALLAVRAIEALVRRDPGVTQAGWVGVDMILGARDDGLDDRVLEVNPRLTTSFVGLSSGRSGSLVRAIVAAAAGREVAALDPSAITSFTLSHDMSAASPV